MNDLIYHSSLNCRKNLAETTGFEPVVAFNGYNGLANRRFQPLSHVSALRYWRKSYSSRRTNFVKRQRHHTLQDKALT